MRLDNGDRFPELTVELAGGGSRDLPGDVDPGWAVLLFYRGHW